MDGSRQDPPRFSAPKQKLRIYQRFFPLVFFYIFRIILIPKSITTGWKVYETKYHMKTKVLKFRRKLK